MERGLKGMLCEEQLKEAAIFNLEKGKINSHVLALLFYLKPEDMIKFCAHVSITQVSVT